VHYALLLHFSHWIFNITLLKSLPVNCHLTNEPQKVTLKELVTDVIAISSTEPARLPVLQVGGHFR